MSDLVKRLSAPYTILSANIVTNGNTTVGFGNVSLNDALITVNGSLVVTHALTVNGVPITGAGGGGSPFPNDIIVNDLAGGVTVGTGAASDLQSVAFGYQSLYSNAIGYNNTALGAGTLYTNNTGHDNTAVGNNSLYLNTSGIHNTAIGSGALENNTTGSNNIAIGSSPLLFSTTGNDNIAIGNNSLQNNTNGYTNIGLGTQTLTQNTTGYFNIAIGDLSMMNSATGVYNIALGSNTLYATTSGFYNIAVGQGALANLTTGSYNVALGPNAGAGLLGAESYNVILGGNNGSSIVGLNNYVIISDGAGNERIWIDNNGNVNIVGPSLTATTFNGNLVGNVTGNVTGSASSATNADNISVTPTTNNGNYYLTFVSHDTGYYSLQVSDSVTINPSFNSITATSFIGSLTGNADTATNLYGPVELLDGTTAVTQTSTDNSGNIATTAFVQTLTAGSGVSKFNNRTGNVTLSSTDVTSALTYTPVNNAGDTITGNLIFSGGPQTITGLPNPVNSSDVANKYYVDLATTALNLHAPVEVATTANLVVTITNGTTDLNGGVGIGLKLTSVAHETIVIDTYSLLLSDRVLVKNQANATVNGIYTVSNIGAPDPSGYSWTLTRATDDDDHIAGQVAIGDYVFVSNGSVNKSTSWVQTGTGSIVEEQPIIGTDNIVYTQFGGAANYSAGTGLTLTGTVFSVVYGAGIESLPSGDVGINVYTGGGLMTTIDGTISNTAVNSQLSLTKVGTAGTYNTITTDAYGRVTFGSNTTPASSVANNLYGGSAGTIPYQTAANTTAMLGAGTAGNVLISGGAGAPSWTSTPTFTALTINGLTNVSSITGDQFKISNDTSPFREGSSSILSSGSLYTLVGDYTQKYYTHNVAIDITGNFLGVDDSDNATLSVFTESAFEKTWNQPPALSGNIPIPGLWTLTRSFDTVTGDVYYSGSISAGTSFSGPGTGLTNIPNGALTYSNITIGSTSINLGGTSTTLTGLTSVTATTFNGNISGSAGSATYATNSLNSNITVASTNINYYPTFVSSTSGNLALDVGTGLTFNPNSNTLTTTTFVGNVTGNVSGSAATVTTAAQPAITSVGTLTVLTVTGTITGNISGSANVATNLSDGVAGSVPYQTAANTTTMLGIGSTGQVLTIAGGVPTWANASSGGATITDDTSTVATRYPLFSANTSGSSTTVYTSSTKLNFNPNTGTLSATVINSLSDATVKTNISTIKNAVNTVNQLNGVSFNWKDTGAKSYGVIAQELEKILPDLVAESDGLKAVNYSGLIGFLINAVKEMDAAMKDMDARIKNLEK